MKHLFSIMVLLAAFVLNSAAQLVLPDNSTVAIFGDSFFHDGDSTSPQTGCMFPDYLMSAYYLGNPDATNIAIYNFGRSGGNMADQTYAVASLAMPAWAFNAFTGNFHGTNWGLSQTTENGGMVSNAFWLAASNMFQAPLVMTNATTGLNTNNGGWCGSNVVAWRAIGEPGTGADSGNAANDFGRNNAGTNASGLYGIGGVDCYSDSLFWWSNSYALNPSVLYITNVNKNGHLKPAAQLSWTISYLKMSTTDTNVAACTLDWNGTVVATNHCVVLSPGQSANTLTFTQHCYRLPLAWDYPGTDPSGATITNDASDAYTRVNTNQANLFHFDIQVTNIPAGNYDVKIDGTLVAHNLTNTVLAAGWNMFTNTVGPYWQQRLEVLGRCRDIEYANRGTLVVGASGDGIGFAGYASQQSATYPAHQGDDLVTNVLPASGKSALTYIWGLQTNSTRSFAAIRTAAIQTNHTITITQISPLPVVFAPAVVQIEKPLKFVWNPGGYSNFFVMTSDDLERRLPFWSVFTNTTETNFTVFPDRAHQFFAVAGVDLERGYWDWCVDAAAKSNN